MLVRRRASASRPLPASVPQNYKRVMLFLAHSISPLCLRSPLALGVGGLRKAERAEPIITGYRRSLAARVRHVCINTERNVAAS